ncbi:transcriptional regulator [Mycolicibacter sinensis]|uniref:Transcriptional regulator n=1 Tax=Mycolicibacter sinensis (strain JDM601) TaxID=875328 RepID=A0A1A2ELL6_MYCSD|nr:transcriptional regulator [Mycolicibacter sinensis]OBG06363.1 transcriptional regulator [Mycolicibacter sinensis]
MRQVPFQRARSEEKKRQRAEALVEAARAVALEAGVASVTLTAVASRAGVHHSAVRRYFSSYKEVLLRLSAESWQRWSESVCTDLDQPGPMSPERVVQTLVSGLVADPLFCDLLSNLHLHLEHEVDAERVIEVRRVSAAAVMASAGAIERALPALGPKGALDLLLAAYSLGSVLWQVSHPPPSLTEAYADEPELAPGWDLDFGTALTRLLTATCMGLLEQSA